MVKTVKSHDLKEEGLPVSSPLKKEREIWRTRLNRAQKEEKEWRVRAARVIERYRDERLSWHRNRSKFNILWANIETLRPTLYSRCPRPDVRRRFRDEDPIGKNLAEIFERSLACNLDSYDFDHVMNQAVLDYLLVGRAITRVRLETKQKNEKKTLVQRVYAEPVHWQDFVRGEGRYWHEVEWIAFRHKLRIAEIKERFGKDISKDAERNVPLLDTQQNLLEDQAVDKRIIVWEIWDKIEKQVIFFAPEIDMVLEKADDPLKLKHFFPIPQPLYSFEDTGNLVPVPDYCCYKDQADELDRLTDRISKLVRALKARGVFDSRVTEFQDLMTADDAELIPAENISLLLQAGGIEKAVWFLPIDQIANVLQSLYAQREHLKQSIYEITGISDVLRGSSQAGETATAQSIKAQYGSQRLQRRQREVQRYSRDVLRLKGEIMGKHFSIAALEKMAGVQMDMETKKTLQADGVNDFRIDIETDSTIIPDLQEDQKNMSQLLTSIVGFIQGITPAVQNGSLPLEAAKSLLLATVRRHRLGREVEDALNQIGHQSPMMTGEVTHG